MKMWRLAPVIVALLVLPRPAAAQEWIEYSSTQDRFSVNFPSQPTIREFTYTSWRDVKLPAREHFVQRGAERYSVTMVDYNLAEKMHAERVKTCSNFPQNLCAGNDSVAQGVGAWKYDVEAAPDKGAEDILKRGSKVTYFAWATIDRIVGRQIHLTNPDGSRTFVQIHMLMNRLYIIEATVPARAPEPGLFQQSPRFLDAEGRGVRYPDNYIDMYGLPLHSRQLEGNPGGGRGGGRGAQPNGQGGPGQGQQ